MKKVKSFFHTLSKSLVPQHEYYKHLAREPFSSSFVYLVSLLVLINSITIVFFFSKLQPLKLRSYLDNVRVNLQSYPNDQVLHLSRGRLLSTANRPYFLWTDYKQMKQLLLVIDGTATPSKINQYNSAILITAKSIVIKDMQLENQYRTLPLSLANDQIINSQTIARVREILAAIVKNYPFYLTVFTLLLFIVLPLVSLVTTLFYLFVATLIAYLIFLLFIKKGDWEGMKHMRPLTVFKLGLHAATLPLLLDYGLNLFGLTSRPLPLLFFALLSVFVFGAMYEAYYEEHPKLSHVRRHRHKS